MKTQDESEFNDALGQRLSSALGELRVDPKDFAAGVRERIGAAPEKELKLGETRPLEATQTPAPSWSTRVQRAAAFLPPLLLPKAVAKGAGLAGGLAAKQSSWKFLPGLLAFPALVLLMFATSFWIFLRQSVASGGQMSDEQEAKIETKAWWRRHFVPVLLCVLLFGYGFKFYPVEAILLLFGVSMFSLAGIFSTLAKAGLATRAEIARRSVSSLYLSVWIGISFLEELPVLMQGQELTYGVPLSLVAGALLCGAIGEDWSSSKGRRLGLTAILWGLVIGALMMGIRGVPRSTQVRSDQAREFLEGGFVNADSFEDQWLELMAARSHLLASQTAAPEMRTYRAELTRYLGRVAPNGSDGTSPYGLSDLALQGFLSPEELEGFGNPYVAARIFDEQAVSQANLRTSLNGVAMVPLDGISPDQRRLACERLLDLAPEPGVYGSLEIILRLDDTFRHLGVDPRTLGMQERAREVLRRHWTGAPAAYVACFSSTAKSVERDAEGRAVENRVSSIWLDTSAAALHLLARYGFPEELDIAALQRYLRTQASPRWLDFDVRNALAAAALAHLESLPEWQTELERRAQRSWLEVFLHHRLFLGGLALALFFVLVTLRAPLAIRGA